MAPKRKTHQNTTETKTPKRKTTKTSKPKAAPKTKTAGSRKRKRSVKIDLQNEDRIQKMLEERDKSTREKIVQLSEEQLRELLNNVVNRQPGMIFNLLEELEKGSGGDSPAPPPPPPPTSSLPWCVCGECRRMPTQLEEVCCQMTGDCLSKSAEFRLVALEPMVLNIANNYRNDFFGINEVDGDEYNKNFRHAAYRQFVMWRSGYLGANNRKVIPSCCVWAIRDKFPSPSGTITGFKPDRLA